MGGFSIAINPTEDVEVMSKLLKATTGSTHVGGNRINIPSVITTRINSNVIKVFQGHTAGEFEVFCKGEFPEVSLVFLEVISRSVRELDDLSLSSSPHLHFMCLVRPSIPLPRSEGKDVQVVETSYRNEIIVSDVIHDLNSLQFHANEISSHSTCLYMTTNITYVLLEHIASASGNFSVIASMLGVS